MRVVSATKYAENDLPRSKTNFAESYLIRDYRAEMPWPAVKKRLAQDVDGVVVPTTFVNFDHKAWVENVASLTRAYAINPLLQKAGLNVSSSHSKADNICALIDFLTGDT